MTDPKVKRSFSVADVLGELEVAEMESYLHTKCNAEVMNVDGASEFDITSEEDSVVLDPTLM